MHGEAICSARREELIRDARFDRDVLPDAPVRNAGERDVMLLEEEVRGSPRWVTKGREGRASDAGEGEVHTH